MRRRSLIPPIKDRAPRLAAEHDRLLAIHEVNEFFEIRVIDQVDRDHRVDLIKLARTMAEIESCLADLRAGRGGPREKRVGEDDRDAARRRLALHHAAKELQDLEYQRRVKLVDGAQTKGEIEDAFDDLAELRPRRQGRRERLTTKAERDAAIKRLGIALVDEQIDELEYVRRCDIVQDAQTHGELQPAFNGLEREPQKQLTAVKDIGTGVVRGGRAVLAGMIMLGWAIASGLVVIFWAVLGIGAIVPIVFLVLITLVTAALVKFVL